MTRVFEPRLVSGGHFNDFQSSSPILCHISHGIHQADTDRDGMITVNEARRRRDDGDFNGGSPRLVGFFEGKSIEKWMIKWGSTMI
jgi:hypothetical protein